MDRRVRRTKTAIRTAFFELLKEKGSQKITVAEIARKADIDRKTFYLHYETADDIIQEFVMEQVEELHANLKETEFYQDPLAIDQLFFCVHQLLTRDLEIYRVLARDPNCHFFWDEIRRITEEVVVAVYGEKVTATEQELRVYARFFLHGITSMYIDWLAGDDSIDAIMVASAVVKIAEEGVLNIIKR